ncbi:hypothetical protein SAMN04488061_2794 [Filomicrobium insigne]|uniref:Uncharacterized protein n=1 Tax=Filomicrobium insigne TaxID=418854 RepID=A0A1H0S9J5_9HYPH|nr:hypothetical protein SAMN04488061_2794 [Filomicrobium insigne]
MHPYPSIESTWVASAKTLFQATVQGFAGDVIWQVRNGAVEMHHNCISAYQRVRSDNLIRHLLLRKTQQIH